MLRIAGVILAYSALGCAQRVDARIVPFILAFVVSTGHPAARLADRAASCLIARFPNLTLVAFYDNELTREA